MKPSSISQIQKELTTFDQPQLIDVCMRLAKYKKENKELLSYLLFEEYDENKFIRFSVNTPRLCLGIKKIL